MPAGGIAAAEAVPVTVAAAPAAEVSAAEIAAAAAARAADEAALFVPSPYATPAKPEEAELAGAHAAHRPGPDEGARHARRDLDSGEQPLRIALAQLAPRLGELEANLERHHALLREARANGAGLVVFPELGLTGTCSRTSRPRSRCVSTTLGSRSSPGDARACAAVVSFVEESGDHRLFIAAALLEDGEIRHVHRKVFLPMYGQFDERRFFAPGDPIRATPSQLGVASGSRCARTSGISRRRSSSPSTARSCS